MAGQADPLVSGLRVGPFRGAGAAHPAVLDRRIRDLLVLGLSALIPAALALGITIEFPGVSVFLVVGMVAAVIGVFAFVVNTRLEITILVLAVYLGLLNGPVKLGVGAHELTGAIPDILVAAICAGALMRMVVAGERPRMPPLSAWVLAFVGTVMIEAFNPKTHGVLKIAGGFRQELQWVAFFFFGYILMRSKRRLRVFFIVVAVCASANAIVASYQTSLAPAQLASWGPGYRALYQPVSIGKSASGARVYDTEGEAHARPVGLGSDAGFSGGIGELALPFSLALFLVWRGRRRWVAAALALSSLVGIIAGLGRLQVITGVLGVIAFVSLATVGGQSRRALVAVLTVVALAIPFGAVYVGLLRSGTFKRYETLETGSATEIATHKQGAYTLIPHLLSVDPFGVGLGTVGAVGGFGGHVEHLLEGHGVSAETEYNLLADELGAPGLVAWSILSLYVIAVIVRGMRRIRDPELVLLLAAAFAPFCILPITGSSGPFSVSPAAGSYFWFAIGIAAYWFAGGRRDAIPSPERRSLPTAAVAA